jgi:hypothetical protein
VFFIRGDPMVHAIIKQKVIAEIDVSKNGLGDYKMFSFLMSLLNDQTKVERFMLNEGYTKSEVYLAQTKFNAYLQKKNNKALVEDRAF